VNLADRKDTSNFPDVSEKNELLIINDVGRVS